MTTSELNRQRLKLRRFLQIFRLPVATLVVVAIATFTMAIAAAWFAGEATITQIFAHIHIWQETPPTWVQVPNTTPKYLLIPTVTLVIIALAVIRISPEPKKWSRAIVVGIMLALTIRYVLWRSLATLNLDDPLNGILSLGLFLLEMLMIFISTIQLYLMLRMKDRRRETNIMAHAVESQTFTPSVDVLIPTYNEPEFILRRTIIGCQALDYPHKKIYLLDDTRRPEIKALAQELGCEYMTRPNNLYAKAGNLNYAIAKTKGELIVVFDADFIPTKNFLNRTLGFFQNQKVALVQTPQSFYNSDPIARNLGLENVLTPDEEVFYRQIEIIKDGAESVVCCGTSFVVRRSALEAVGGFVTDSISEDYFTGIRLSAKGYSLIYLDEKLSAGLAAENIGAHLTQRLRWARGTLQGFFIDSNPLTIKGLKFIQRLAHLEGLLNWFDSLTRVIFLTIPLVNSFLGTIPFRATGSELLYFFLPYCLFKIIVFSWLNRRSRSALLSDVYSFVLCIPLAFTVIQVMLNPFNKGFKVTPKGISSDRFRFNWGLALPYVVLFVLTAIGLWHNLSIDLNSELNPTLSKGIRLNWIWGTYNLIMLGIAILVLVDVPKPDIYDWFQLQRVVKLKIGNRIFWGITTLISEVGAEVSLTQSLSPIDPLTIDYSSVEIEIMQDNLELPGQIIRTNFNGNFPTLRIAFDRLTIPQHRSLVEMLFCRPGQWKCHETPGELPSLLLLFKILLKPRFIFDRNREVKAMAISQV
ncbi:cellulose synthase catalytic subunit [Oscillatoriales cyanobacterium USR001]|nr:cellulose synthase catalytic subunit [Oscillatoriales cyanobacterium USR001]